jgi:hypothetical protein
VSRVYDVHMRRGGVRRLRDPAHLTGQLTRAVAAFTSERESQADSAA